MRECRAWREIDPVARKRAALVQRALTTAWLSDDYLFETARRLSALFPDSLVAVYNRGRDGALDEIVHSGLGSVRRAPFFESAQSHLQNNHRYVLAGDDPFANRAASTTMLYRSDRAALRAIREQVFHPYGVHYQLRVAGYHRSRFFGYLGFLRARKRGEYGVEDRMLLDAVAPTVLDGMVMMQAIGTQLGSASQVVRALQLFHEPAYIVTEHGAVAFANAAAQQSLPEPPEWLPLGPSFEFLPRSLGRMAQLELDGRAAWIVLPRSSEGATTGLCDREGLDGLPPALAQVAELLLAGLADKEIAEHTDLSLSTVRTYVTRIFRRLGVHSRTELMARFAEARRDSGGRGREG